MIRKRKPKSAFAAVTQPECDKVVAVREQSQAIGEFLDWLRYEKKLTLCRLHEHDEDCYAICNNENPEYVPEMINIEKLLAEFFGIDLNRLEQEKRAILEDLRRAHKE